MQYQPQAASEAGSFCAKTLASLGIECRSFRPHPSNSVNESAACTTTLKGIRYTHTTIPTWENALVSLASYVGTFFITANKGLTYDLLRSSLSCLMHAAMCPLHSQCSKEVVSIQKYLNHGECIEHTQTDAKLRLLQHYAMDRTESNDNPKSSFLEACSRRKFPCDP